MTGAETIAAAITDAAHILASAIRAHTPHQTPQDRFCWPTSTPRVSPAPPDAPERAQDESND